jgi:hypothetical protein
LRIRKNYKELNYHNPVPASSINPYSGTPRYKKLTTELNGRYSRSTGRPYRKLHLACISLATQAKTQAKKMKISKDIFQAKYLTNRTTD